MRKRFFSLALLTLALLAAPAGAQEILRPTANLCNGDPNSGGNCAWESPCSVGNGVNQGGVQSGGLGANAYDSSGNGTYGVDFQGNGSFAGYGWTESEHGSWPAATKTYNQLVLGVTDAYLTNGVGGRAAMFFSLDGGNTFATLFDTGGLMCTAGTCHGQNVQAEGVLHSSYVQHVVVIPPNQDLTKLVVAACVDGYAGSPNGAGTINVWDICTCGDYSGESGTCAGASASTNACAGPQVSLPPNVATPNAPSTTLPSGGQCPVGSTVLTDGQTMDPVTGKLTVFRCIDARGNVTISPDTVAPRRVLAAPAGIVVAATANGAGTCPAGQYQNGIGSNVNPLCAQVNTLGSVGNYNGIGTVRNGVPADYAAKDQSTQVTAAVSATTIFTTPASTGNGTYELTYTATITQAATTSSTLGPVSLICTDNDSGNVVTIAGNVSSTGNTTGTAIGGDMSCNAKANTNIQFSIGYASSGATPMGYVYHITLSEK